MKELKEFKLNVYELYENNKRLYYSFKFERILNFTIKTKDTKIYYNGQLIWVQNP